MEQEYNYEQMEAEVRKIRYNLFEIKTEMSMGQRLKLLNIMRYDLGLLEDKNKVKKVVYDTDYIELHSFNPMYPVMRYEGKDVLRIQVVGLVKKVIKDINL